MRTGNSLTVIFTGTSALGVLVVLAKKIFEARESLHKSETAKWQAGSAKDDYELGGVRKVFDARESFYKFEEARWKALSAKQDYLQKAIENKADNY